MPQEIICSGCGKVLYNGGILKSPQDVIKKYEGKCPTCGKELNSGAMEIEITSSDAMKKSDKKREKT